MPDRDPISWTTLFLLFAQTGHLELSHSLFQQMPAQDLIAWTALITSHARIGRPGSALALSWAMQIDGHAPDDATFTSLLPACSHAGDVRTGICWLRSMDADWGLTPSKEQYGCVVDLLGRSGHLAAAEELVATMPYTPEALDWICLLSRSDSAVGFGRGAAKQAMELSPESPASYILLSNITTKI
ncbi:hypothetical protein SELMODRAFT_122247 [Selaginella moellendorffii]|uniref:Pentacotripeptide-repeat region of PRORP domain-containing protein n=2 Tax=Selaginella moellendorffii TaxID=88036 RepID=D8SPW1_SELML|nr:hypothetical protein SELMODRAFT_122247 [Selaginella moellendorffii]